MSRKSLVIMRSEFMRRITSKAFILTTLLGPALLLGFFAIIIFISISALEDTSQEMTMFGEVSRSIAIVDETGVLESRIMNQQEEGAHTFLTADANAASGQVLRGEIDAYIHISEDVIHGTAQPVLYSQRSPNFIDWSELERIIEKSLEDHLLEQQNIDVSMDVRAILDRTIWFDTVRLSELSGGVESPDSYAVLGAILGMIMYMAMLIYGTLIMYGAIEERSTRVVEVIISSVRPFDLLMGKVLGIGLVGLVQMMAWMIMIVSGLLLASPIIGMFIDPGVQNLSDVASNQEILSRANISLPQVSPILMTGFLFYFIGGYLLYGGLFAVVGTLVDSPQESQTLLLPLIMPMIITIMFLSPIIMNPDGGLSIGLSLFPLTSPVPMVVRLAMGNVPAWQLLLSYGLLVLSFLGSIWISARIYRVSLLMYGKKISFKRIIGYLWGR